MKTPRLLTHSCLLWAALMFATQPVTAQDFALARPRDGEHFLPGDAIPLRAEASDDPTRPWQVAFLDGDRVIAEANVNMTIWWENAGGGSHVIAARATNPDGTTLTSAPATIQVGPGPALPVVSVRADPWQTAEPCPTCRMAPAILTLRRSSPTTAPLVVQLQVDGTATPDQDYPAFPARMEFPAGQEVIQIPLGAMDDLLAEGPEVVWVRLAPTVPSGATTYLVSAHAREALIVIGDDEAKAPEARLDIVLPKNGQHFPPGPPGITLPITAIAVWSQGEVQSPVEFYAGDQLIGATPGSAVMRPPIPGLPSVHTFQWTNPPVGEHVLRARTELSLDRPLESPPVRIVIDKEVPLLPVVRIVATQRLAEEDCSPLERLPFAGVFAIWRTGPTINPLPVFVQYSGTASPGVDYPPPPWVATIPAGAASTEIRIVPNRDDLVEGIETLVVTISNCPPDRDPALGIPCSGFEVDPAHASATVFLRDDGVTVASLVLTNPKEGATIPAGQPILIEAVAIDLEGYIDRVEFWDGDHSVGFSQIDFFRAPDPGTPIFHQFEWRGALPGPHVLTVRAASPNGVVLVSNPVKITVAGEPPRNVVRIEATQRIAEESSFPYRRLAFVGEFTITRTGPTNASLPVFVQAAGTATPGDDYPRLPWLVTIPAGATSAVLRVEAIPDEVTEGIETLVATLSNCPPPTIPPMGMPCYAFDVDPAHASATVFLRDDGLTVASLAMEHPKDGARFEAGATIPCLAVAIDLESYISRVEFRDGDQRIGVSEIIFVRAPDPGTPIHHPFAWTGASAGGHALTAHAVNSAGITVQSTPVRITVASPANQPPTIAIVRPAAGAEFPPMTAIEIVAEARDADGSVRRVEFFADGRKIGEAGGEFLQPSPPGETQSFPFVWRSPSPGRHVLTARAMDNEGSGMGSAPVEIRVTEPERVPLVTVRATDLFAMEPGTSSPLNTATFRIRRFGPTNAALIISYSLRGTAQNGVDFDPLSGLITLPAGQRTIEITVRPLKDELVERLETVFLQLGESPVMDPLPHYRIGVPAKAVAVISDPPWLRPPVMGRCLPVGDGVLHVCFDAESGYPFRVEASRDLKNWETVCDAVAADGTVHVVDEDTASGPQRFYRIAPEPLGVPEP